MSWHTLIPGFLLLLSMCDVTWSKVRQERQTDGLYNAAELQTPQKRLGIFRCNGWGPGCMQMRTYGSRTQRHAQRQADAVRSAEEPSKSAASHDQFFTLTSGASWGPMGKRSLPITQPIWDTRSIGRKESLLKRWILNEEDIPMLYQALRKAQRDNWPPLNILPPWWPIPLPR